MKLPLHAAALLLSLAVTPAFGQTILHDYFQDNVDSMVRQATQLIALPDPVFKPWKPLPVAPGATKQPENGTTRRFILRDNSQLVANRFVSASPVTILLLHGVKSSADRYTQTAMLLREATHAEVYALDLRGHGKSDGTPGDVDYINQYTDDLADVITVIRNEKPEGKIIIAGHSMGGGVALQYALLNNSNLVDGFLLFAPLIGHDSPAVPQVAPAATDSVEPGMKIHIARIIGLTMLNELGRHAFDSLPVLFFNVPEQQPLRTYSYRANKSMAPEHYRDGLRTVRVPMLVLVGSADEAFGAAELKKAILENSSANVQVVEGETHAGITCSEKAFDSIGAWFLANKWSNTTAQLSRDVPANESDIRRIVKMNWEFAIGDVYLATSRPISNRLRTEFQPISGNYYVTAKVPVLKSFDRFGGRLGVGPRWASYGLDQVITESNNMLVFTPIPAGSLVKTSFFQQLFIDVPLFLYYETPGTKKGVAFSVEWGGIFGFQVYNRWKTIEQSNTLLLTQSRENISHCRTFQFGNSVKLGVVKNRGKFTTGFFIQGTYYSTAVFRSSVNVPANSYDIKIGLQFTANKLPQ